jgi:transposase-like protein
MNGYNQKNVRERLLKAFLECRGIIACTCKKVGVSRQTFNYWVRTDEDFSEKVQEILEEQIDFVENQLLKGVENGNDKLIQFYLRTKGKKRGYGESTDFTTKGEAISQPIINISVVNPRIDGLEGN